MGAYLVRKGREHVADRPSIEKDKRAPVPHSSNAFDPLRCAHRETAGKGCNLRSETARNVERYSSCVRLPVVVGSEFFVLVKRLILIPESLICRAFSEQPVEEGKLRTACILGFVEND